MTSRHAPGRFSHFDFGHAAYEAAIGRGVLRFTDDFRDDFR